MFNPLSLNAPYDAETFLDQLPGYDSSKGVIEQLDIVRAIQESGDYYWLGISFPHHDNLVVAAGDTVNGSIQVPPGSYITSIQTYCDYVANPAGFKLNLYDKGSSQNLYYGDYDLDRLAGSDMQLQYGVDNAYVPSDPGMNLDSPFGPGYRMSPIIITSPGVIGWEIVNSGDSDSVIQVMICLAVPINEYTIGQRLINRGS
jgi:hypothetical protein